METINIKAYTADTTQVKAIKAFMKALKIKFEVMEESPYDPEFVAMIKKGQKEIAQGKGIKMSVSEFKNLCK
jgi:uncharacterized membrane protein (DUF106 family)